MKAADPDAELELALSPRDEGHSSFMVPGDEKLNLKGSFMVPGSPNNFVSREVQPL